MLDFNINERNILVMMRREKGISQREVAQHIGMHQPKISNFEKGKYKLTDDRYIKYKNFIVNYDQLVKDSQSQEVTS